MECTEAVRQTAAQVANIPPDTQRIVIPVGSGMSLAGVLTGLEAMGNYRTFVLGVVVGASPHKRLDKFAPINWFGRVVLAQSEVPYHSAVVPAVLPGTELELDPIYEAKCIEYLKPGDLLWVVGRRNA
jgi:1-aminocyclopropane-1-carboxylate deaminase/D-cysteine desulfhydrase-like pyridoxal-dependent ACC family enzyme